MHKVIAWLIAWLALGGLPFSTKTLAAVQPPCVLIGQPASVTVAPGGQATTTVLTGLVEFNPAPGNPSVAVDVEAATVRIYNNSAATIAFASPVTYTVSLGGLAPLTITGISTGTVGVTGFTPASVSFTPGSVSVTTTGMSFQPGGGITVTLHTTCFDVDGNGATDALTDGLLILRRMQGLIDTALTTGALGAAATRNATQIADFLIHNAAALDVDGDGQLDPLIDGVIILRYMFGWRGDALIAGGVGQNATRTTPEQIVGFIDELMTSPQNQPPLVSAGMNQTILLPSGASLVGTAADDGLPNPPATLTFQWTKLSGPGIVAFTDATALSTMASFASSGVYVLRLSASDGTLSGHSDVTITAIGAPPPDPTTVAPPLDLTVAGNVYDATAFLYTGPSPTQVGVAPGTIRPQRVAVLRGRVLKRDGTPLPGVVISVLDHEELGLTQSRTADGAFDLVVNGGGLLTLNYAKPGYLTVQRQANVPWQDYVVLDPVVMIPVDTVVTAITPNAGTAQVARGSVQSDSDGARQTTVLFPAGTTAALVQPDGSTVPAGTLHVRMTEYTVGPNGPQAMPAALPPTSAYTYAVELSADEAVAKVDGRDVVFNQPVFVYVENFLGYPVGGIVPVGYYDRGKAAWIPADNGRVIKIVGITTGAADIDSVGAGSLPPLTLSLEERQTLASLYSAGQELWRVPTQHFSTHDYNWPPGLPPDASPPPYRPPEIKFTPPKDDCLSLGSIIGCQSQTLGEALPLTGSRFRLHYSSDRALGRKDARLIEIPLSGSSVPASLTGIRLEVLIAGRQFIQQFPPLPNQSTTFQWDGFDVYGRPVPGSLTVTVLVGYEYTMVSSGPAPGLRSFGLPGTEPIAGVPGRLAATLWQATTAPLMGDTRYITGIGGWSITPHHAYDPGQRVLYRGDGTRRDGRTVLGAVITTFAGGTQVDADNVPATQVALNTPAGMAVAPDGTVYVADFADHRIRRIDTDGIISTVAGFKSQDGGFSGDGGPATQAELRLPSSLALAADGSLYIADFLNHRVRRIGTDGIITTVAGNGTGDFAGDDGPATQASLNGPYGVAVAPDGTLYIADRYNNRVRRVGPDGIITTFAGTGSAAFGGDNGLAKDASLKQPVRLAVGPDGSLYIVDQLNIRIRRVGPDGIITTVAGNGGAIYSGDGGPATQAGLGYYPGLASLNDVAVRSDGSLVIDAYGQIRYVSPDGIISTIAGFAGAQIVPDTSPAGTDGGPATRATLQSEALAVGPDGSVYLSTNFGQFDGRVRRVAPANPGLSLSDVFLASDDGSEVYIFNGAGRHLRTHEALTGTIRHQFGYDAAGRLATITDADNNVTSVLRNGNGDATAIVAPGGQQTTLTVDANGYLASAKNPANEATLFVHSSDGLLASKTDPKNGLYKFTYNATGLLTKDEDPAGGFKTLSRTDNANGHSITLTTALGRTFTYLVERQPTGAVRRVNTDNTGVQTEVISNINGSHTVNYADGTHVTSIFGPDPRFGMQAARVVNRVRALPGGQTETATGQRTVTLANPLDVFSLQTLDDTLTVNNRTFTRHYVASTRTMTDTSPAGRQTVRVLDTRGRVVSVTPAPGMTPITVDYDIKGRVIANTQGAQSWTYTYDLLNRVIARTDAAGHPIGFEYDAADRIVKKTLPSGAFYQFGYDANSNRTQIAMPGGATHALGYSAVDLDTSYTPPGNAAYQIARNVDRVLTGTTLPGGRATVQSYDGTGRVTGIAYTEATTAFDYAGTGATDRVAHVNQTPASGPAQNIAYTYNGSLISAMTATGAAPAQVTYSFNNDLLPTSMNLASGADNVPAALTYDSDGLLTGFGPLALTRTGPRGAITKISDGTANTDTSYGYDTLRRISTRTHKVNAQTAYALQLTYGTTGRITAKTETVGGVARTYTYTYDLDYQLTEVRLDGTLVEQYTYSPSGNRMGRQLNGGPLEGANYDAQDRLTQRGALAYQFNADGFLAQRGADTFVYDTRGRLIQAVAGGQTITYAYDGFGRRVSRTQGANTHQYIYGDPASHLITAVRSPSGVLTTLYYDTAGLLTALERSGVRYYVATDQAGTPRVVSSSANPLLKVLEFDTFGNPLSDSNPGFELPIGFAGGLADPATNLVHFGFRDYEPASGRWTTRDPALFGGGQGNLFAYAANDPVGKRDPTGLFCISASAYEGLGFGIQVCITDEGVSNCLEAGVGLGVSVGVDSGGLEKEGIQVIAEVSAEAGPVLVSVGGTLDDTGCAKITPKVQLGPITFDYDKAGVDFEPEIDPKFGEAVEAKLAVKNCFVTKF